MLSWWVGLSREGFYKEILTRKFISYRYGFSLRDSDPMKEEKVDRQRAFLYNARNVLKHRREMGFDIANQRAVIITQDKKEKELEAIPYSEWAETQMVIREDAEEARRPYNPQERRDQRNNENGAR